MTGDDRRTIRSGPTRVLRRTEPALRPRSAAGTRPGTALGPITASRSAVAERWWGGVLGAASSSSSRCHSGWTNASVTSSSAGCRRSRISYTGSQPLVRPEVRVRGRPLASHSLAARTTIRRRRRSSRWRSIASRSRGQLRNSASCATSRLAPSAPAPETSRRASVKAWASVIASGTASMAGRRCSPPRRSTVVVDLDQLAEHHLEGRLFGTVRRCWKTCSARAPMAPCTPPSDS